MLSRSYVVLRTLLAFLVLAQTMPVYATQAVKEAGASNLPATVPFTSVSGTALILVSVSLDHGKPHLFLVDPGMEGCLIDAKFVKSEHLTIQKQVTTGKTEEGAVIPDQIVLQAPKPFSIPKVPFVVSDISALAGSIRCPELAGVLGASFLNAFIEKIDFTKESIVFYSREGFPASGKQAHRVPLEEDYSLSAEVDGQSTRCFISFMYPTTYLQDHALVALLKPAAKIQAFSVAYGTGNETLRLQSIRVEDMLWSRPVVDHSVDPVRKENMLGVDFFSHFYVTLDLSGKQLYLEPDPNYNEDTERWRQTGFIPESPAAGKLQVSYLYVPSPASEAGLKIGDTILAVNGMPVATTPLAKLFGANEHADTTPIRLKILHKGEANPKEVTVKARQLLGGDIYDLPATGAVVPFETLPGTAIPLVSLSVDGGKPHLYILDPGTYNSAVDTNFATSEQLTTKTMKSEENTEAEVVLAHQIQIKASSPFVVGPVPFLPQDFTSVRSSAGLNGDVVGLLGANFLRVFVEKIDFNKKMITFYPKDGFLPPGKQAYRLPLQVEDYFFYTKAMLDGAPTRFQVRFTYPQTLLQNSALLSTLKPVAKIALHDADDKEIAKALRLRSFSLGDVKQENPTFFHAENLEEKENILGLDFFARFYLTMDISARRYYLERDPNFKEDPTNFLGTGFDAKPGPNGKVKVVILYVPTPASEAGLKIGDEILEVNGLPVDNTSFDTVYKKIKKIVGTITKLKIQREGEAKPREFLLKTRKLL